MTEDKFIKAMDLLTKNDNDSLVNELCDILNYVTSLKNKNEELEAPKSCEGCAWKETIQCDWCSRYHKDCHSSLKKPKPTP